ncbi:hydrogen gas-evolving membrane-bound hydrogenase subunit E [Gaiella sp.]|jgi:multicomponent Na+:H+ antiporter subunit B|uniref:hydrogen gas-evolving membrane-bound hydrogenase subunit E n=1 Tax=Gaiella sp. TaxID=2663207 RepID=UPI002E32770B|nr:hydrogen gas-evolving membrane-bound hydrogenase subunit E [Gaiella sp.]HEX5583844.1 hydrogen gas-evolving membrane-bound hydrogenase subunit E [Gaiella sp.]
MTDRRRVRVVVGAPVLGAFAALLGFGLSGAPRFGEFHGVYGELLNTIAVPQRHTTNVVTAIVFDYRGFDTMGEEFILFAAVIGVVLLLRGEREPPGADADRVESDAVRTFGSLMVGVLVLVGLWLAAFGLVTPGGGFQGGVVIAGGVVVVYLGAGYAAWRRFGDERLLDPYEATGAAAFVVVGLAALVSGTAFLHNLLGAGGEPGTLLSGGSMNLLNWAVAVEVAAANLVLYTEFLESYLVPQLRDR